MIKPHAPFQDGSKHAANEYCPTCHGASYGFIPAQRVRDLASSGITINQLVREQILAEAGEIDKYRYVDDFIDVSDNYINEKLNELTNVELLERISSALDCLMPEIANRLGL